MSRILKFDELTVHVDDVDQMARHAAVDAPEALRATIAPRGWAHGTTAPRTSQLPRRVARR